MNGRSSKLARSLLKATVAPALAVVVVAGVDAYLSRPATWFQGRIVFISDECGFSRTAVASVLSSSDQDVAFAPVGNSSGELAAYACARSLRNLPKPLLILRRDYLCSRLREASTSAYKSVEDIGIAGGLPKWVVNGEVSGVGVGDAELQALGLPSVRVPLDFVH